MSRYHINNEGVTGECFATKKCRFGLTEEQHFPSAQAARDHYEEQNSSNNFSSHKKSRKKTVSSSPKHFDPAKESLFTNPAARKDPTIAGRYIRIETKKALTSIASLQKAHSQIARGGVNKKEFSDLKAASVNSSTRVSGMMQEFKYLMENDSSFKQNALAKEPAFAAKTQSVDSSKKIVLN